MSAATSWGLEAGRSGCLCGPSDYTEAPSTGGPKAIGVAPKIWAWSFIRWDGLEISTGPLLRRLSLFCALFVYYLVSVRHNARGGSLEAERNSKATTCCLTGFRLCIHLWQGKDDFPCFVCLFVSSLVTATLDRSFWWQWRQVIKSRSAFREFPARWRQNLTLKYQGHTDFLY